MFCGTYCNPKTWWDTMPTTVAIDGTFWTNWNDANLEHFKRIAVMKPNHKNDTWEWEKNPMQHITADPSIPPFVSSRWCWWRRLEEGGSNLSCVRDRHQRFNNWRVDERTNGVFDALTFLLLPVRFEAFALRCSWWEKMTYCSAVSSSSSSSSPSSSSSSSPSSAFTALIASFSASASFTAGRSLGSNQMVSPSLIPIV